ncbi:multiple inositol polyphosphate phosphatase 1 [Biomphalaria pfeifferi]|uniref:Multiple inositol polyphosphate phosphatase 1 n=1 Tax=Biomphalaria pfeifferi TaxID=112525 RepID=A0AAD8B5M0_BIOPF|nr:multiple inositol polyphosphate phosphatase 1 [Biomphalaria pfeifferi]
MANDILASYVVVKMAATTTKSFVNCCRLIRISSFSVIFLSTISYGATPYKYFSTKTPYEWVHKPSETVTDELYYLKELQGKSCTAVHTSAVIRHGARFPGLEDVLEISRIHEKIINVLEPYDHPTLYNWVNRFPSNNNKELSQLGEDEQERLGQRIAQKLSTLFKDEDLSDFRFIISSQQRTNQSASAFYEGFINVILSEEDVEDEIDSEVSDDLLRFFNLCAKYVYSVEKNKTAHKEYYDFLSSEHVVKIKNKVHQKLGINDDLLTTADVRLIYLVCGYETAVFKSSPWCSLLDENDLKILEYVGDLKHYYKNGYGFDITCQQSCPMVSEIFLTMDEVLADIESMDSEEATEGLSFTKGQFFFGHAETLGPLYCALGLFNDSMPLKANNYEQHGDRSFLTSKILPFSANLMFVLYECFSDEFQETDEVDEVEYYLKLFVNEKPHQIPGCPELFCPYRTVREKYSSLVDHCDFKQICKRKPTKDEL